MPELPEVQTTIDGINKTAKGLQITDVWTNYNSVHYHGKDEIKDPLFFKKFKEIIIGSTITNSTRRAKNILIHLSNSFTILIHMKMTGHIMYGEYSLKEKVKDEQYKKDPWFSTQEGPLRDPFNRHIRLVFTLNNDKKLVLSDMRRFAKVTVISTDKLTKNKHLQHIGPEPLDSSFTFEVFKERLETKKLGKIKTVLMDQEIIAGVGNIYSDEALWRASINPEEIVLNIPQKNLKNLYQSVRDVLLQGIDFGGDSMSDYRNIHGERGAFQLEHKAYRKTNEPCSRKGCKGKIIRKVIGGRSAHFCNIHQTLIGNINS